MINTGEQLKACRLFRGLSIRELSRISGIPFNTIWGAEHRTSCNMATFTDLLESMGFEVVIREKRK